jgi:lipoprotein-anchoring transpeptidase ErfK/SrfK
MKPTPRWFNYLLLFVGGVSFLWLASNLFVAAWWQGKYYPGTRVAGQAIGGLTRQQAMRRLQKDEFKLSLRSETKQLEVASKEIGLTYDLEATLQVAESVRQRHFWPLMELLNSHPTISYAYRLDRSKLIQYATQIAAGEGKAAVDAQVVIENGQPRVVADQAGYAVSTQQLVRQMEEAIGRAQPQVSVSRQTIAADVKATATTSAVEQAQALMAVPLELTYQEKTYKPSRAEVGGWLAFPKEGNALKAVVEPSKLKNFIQSLANDIYVPPQNKKVTIRNGQVTEESQGKEGLALDQDHAIKIVTATLEQRQPLKSALQTKKVAFKTEYNRTMSLDYGRYIEVNLNLQRLWAYEDHKLVYTSAITSGATGAGFETAKGLFSIYYKTTNTRLRGYQYGWDYDVAVKYWMPFYKGYGLHDASWRGGSFGGQDYYWNGSHGCVNLPDATAAWIYNWASVGTPVWVHR